MEKIFKLCSRGSVFPFCSFHEFRFSLLYSGDDNPIQNLSSIMHDRSCACLKSRKHIWMRLSFNSIARNGLISRTYILFGQMFRLLLAFNHFEKIGYIAFPIFKQVYFDESLHPNSAPEKNHGFDIGIDIVIDRKNRPVCRYIRLLILRFSISSPISNHSIDVIPAGEGKRVRKSEPSIIAVVITFTQNWAYWNCI